MPRAVAQGFHARPQSSARRDVGAAPTVATTGGWNFGIGYRHDKQDA
jgi:hypothetical protein